MKSAKEYEYDLFIWEKKHQTELLEWDKVKEDLKKATKGKKK